MTSERDTSKNDSFAWAPRAEDATVVGGAGGLPVLGVGRWRGIPQLRHGFFGRHGGSSAGALRSLNLSAVVDDDPQALRANWNAVRSSLPGMTVVRMRQVHGDRIVHVRSAQQEVGEADGMVAGVTGVALSILTADCVPLLLVNPSRHLVGAIHAGWRGTLAGIAEGTVRTTERELGVLPDEWQVAMGPSIGGCCYEVDAEIGERIEARWGRMPDAWSRMGSKGQLDLRQANRMILAACGVRSELIFAIGPCTACAQTDFFSHRKSGGRAGRQLSYVGWTANSAHRPN